MTKLYCKKGHHLPLHYISPHDDDEEKWFTNIWEKWNTSVNCYTCDRPYFKEDCLTEEQLKSSPSESENCSRCYNSGYAMGYEDGKTEESNSVDFDRIESNLDYPILKDCIFQAGAPGANPYQKVMPWCSTHKTYHCANYHQSHVHENTASYTHLDDTYTKEQECAHISDGKTVIINQCGEPMQFVCGKCGKAFVRIEKSESQIAIEKVIKAFEIVCGRYSRDIEFYNVLFNLKEELKELNQ